jgi:hypothetical protein
MPSSPLVSQELTIGKMQHFTHLTLAYAISGMHPACYTSMQPGLRTKQAVLASPEFMQTLKLNSCHLAPAAAVLCSPAPPTREDTVPEEHQTKFDGCSPQKSLSLPALTCKNQPGLTTAQDLTHAIEAADRPVQR